MNALKNISPTLQIHELPNEAPEITLKKFNVLGVVIFNNQSDTKPPDKFAPVLRFPTALSTCNAQYSQQSECFWLTRCNGIINDQETKLHHNIDYYFRENFAQIYHVLFKAWLSEHLQSAESDDQSVDESKQLEILDANFVVKSLLIPMQGHYCNKQVTTVTVWFICFFIFFLPYIHLILVSLVFKILYYHYILGIFSNKIYLILLFYSYMAMTKIKIL